MFDDVLSIFFPAFVGPIDIELLSHMDTDGCPMDLLDNQLCIGYFIDISWIFNGLKFSRWDPISGYFWPQRNGGSVGSTRWYPYCIGSPIH